MHAWLSSLNALTWEQFQKGIEYVHNKTNKKGV